MVVVKRPVFPVSNVPVKNPPEEMVAPAGSDKVELYGVGAVPDNEFTETLALASKGIERFEKTATPELAPETS
jgi:hypothetical protein